MAEVATPRRAGFVWMDISALNAIEERWSEVRITRSMARSAYLAMCEGEPEPARCGMSADDLDLVIAELIRIDLVSSCPRHGYSLKDLGATDACSRCEAEAEEAAREATRVDTEEQIAAILKRWAASHAGLAPTKVDWSRERDPEGAWPRAERVERAVRRLPSFQRYRQGDRPHQREAQETDLRNHVNGTDDPYCIDCLHGSGCMSGKLMSPWRYAIEAIGGLELRGGRSSKVTASKRSLHGRNRQMVTGGVADQHPQTIST